MDPAETKVRACLCGGLLDTGALLGCWQQGALPHVFCGPSAGASMLDCAQVHWACPARRKHHERLLARREQQKKAAKEAERAARRSQQRQQRQEQQQQQQLNGTDPQGPGGASMPIKAEPGVEAMPPAPPPPAPTAAAAAAAVMAAGASTSAAAAAAAAVAGDAPDLFDLMMDCAELPEAAAAGFTQELACSFQSLLDMLPPRDQAVKVRGLACAGHAGCVVTRVSACAHTRTSSWR